MTIRKLLNFFFMSKQVKFFISKFYKISSNFFICGFSNTLLHTSQWDNTVEFDAAVTELQYTLFE